MSNTTRTFRATTAEDALAQVRREMGLDAVIVEVKEVSSGGLLGWFSRPHFEVKASRPANVARSTRSVGASVPSNVGTIAAAAAAAAKNLSNTSNAEGNEQTIRRTTTPQPIASRAELAPPPPLLPEVITPANRIAATESPTSNPRNDRWRSVTADVVSAVSPTTPVHSARLSHPNLDFNSPQTIERRLDALQQMIADLGRRTQPRGLADIPAELFPHYMSLVEADVEDELARELIQQVHRHASPEQLSETPSTMALLTAIIEQRIPCDRSIVPTTGRRQIAMVVGPTGVGKTTTLAKLAGRFGIQQGFRLGLITVDTYRVAAVEQLRTYAEIIDLPMRIVTNAMEMQDALDSLAHCDLVLIDTAGRSPLDENRLSELKQFIDVARPDHVYLVLSLTSGAKALRTAAERFATIKPTSLVMTKLDEATGCGGLLSASRDLGLPISYVTTGQEVPRDIEPANPCRAARLVMGLESVQSSKPLS